MSQSWLSLYRPASFRGVPFYVEVAEATGGRRLAVTELLDQDDADVADMGGAEKRYPVTAYLIGDGYFAARDALRRACDARGAATLVHPYYGTLTVRSGAYRVRDERDRGGYCVFEVEFVQSAPPPTARGNANTASGLLSGLGRLLPVITQAYAYGSLIADRPSVLLGFAENLLGGAADSFLGLPASTTLGLIVSASGWLGSAASGPAATASLVAGTLSDAADAVVAAQQAQALAAVSGDSVGGTVPNLSPSTDLTGGLATLAGWGATLPPVPALAGLYGTSTGYAGYVGPADPAQAPPGVAPLAVLQAATQQALVDLVAGATVAAVATIYAQLDFPTADAADAAAQQLGGLIDDRITAAAYAGADDLYRAWSIVQGLVVTDMTLRAQGLPSRATYGLPRSLPSLVLAQRLYADPTRADELVALNDVSHPAFMPASGIRLSA